jgi:hypothetical protein
LFGNPFIGDGDPIVHQKFSDYFILFRINNGISIEVSFLQRYKIRETMGIIEKEQGSREKKQKAKEDKGINRIKGQSPFPFFFRTIVFFHEEKT